MPPWRISYFVINMHPLNKLKLLSNVNKESLTNNHSNYKCIYKWVNNFNNDLFIIMGSKDEGKINKPSHDYGVKKENVGKGCGVERINNTILFKV